MTMYKTLDDAERAEFHRDFDNPRTLAYIHDREARNALKSQVAGKNFNGWLYRYGCMSMSDWSMYTKLIGGPKVINKAQLAVSGLDIIKRDLVSKILRIGDLVTMPSSGCLAIMDALAGDAPAPAAAGFFYWEPSYMQLTKHGCPASYWLAAPIFLIKPIPSLTPNQTFPNVVVCRKLSYEAC